MLKELIKLNNYLNKTNNYYLNKLQQIIKQASQVEESIAVLNDYLIENGFEEDKLLNYDKSHRFLKNLINAYGKFSHDNNIKFICEQIYQQIDNPRFFLWVLENIVNKNIISNIQNEILTQVIKNLIVYLNNYENSVTVNNLITTINLILAGKSLDEKMNIYLQNNYYLDNNYLYNEYYNEYYNELYQAFLELLTNGVNNSLFAFSSIGILEKKHNIDCLSIIKKHIPTLNDLYLNYKLAKLNHSMIKEASSISSLVSLGYPEVVAKIIRKLFGENSYVLAKWLKEFRSKNGDDFIHDIGGRTSHWGKKSLSLALDKYNAAQKGVDSYIKFLNDNEFHVLPGETLNEDYLDFAKEDAKSIMEESIKNDLFFYNTFLEDIINGKVPDLNPYKRLSFKEAEQKYNKKKIFQDREPILSYPNGWRWIDVGQRCELVGSLMSNCGSAGIMSNDPDRTIIALFDDNNKPHVLVTYSPNEKRISGYEGKASSGVKEEYSHYVINLTDHLGARLDVDKSESVRSKYLVLSYQLRNFAEKISKLDTTDINFYTELFEVQGKNGITYYSDSYSLIPVNLINQFINEHKDDDRFKAIELYGNHTKEIHFIHYLFNHSNTSQKFKEKHENEIKNVRAIYRETVENIN